MKILIAAPRGIAVKGFTMEFGYIFDLI